MSDSVRPNGQQPTRLLCPQDSLGKNTGVGCHFLVQRFNLRLTEFKCNKTTFKYSILIFAIPDTIQSQSFTTIQIINTFCWVGQKVPSGFSISCYMMREREKEMNS